MRSRRRRIHQEADLDVTAFMNLMIILVPFLLMTMVFAQITTIDVGVSETAADPDKRVDEKIDQLELVVRDTYIDVNYPAGTRQKRIENLEDGQYDIEEMVTTLKILKQRMKQDLGIEKDKIHILLEKKADYQSLVTIMDNVRSFTSTEEQDGAQVEVQAALFPVIKLDYAPQLTEVNP